MFLAPDAQTLRLCSTLGSAAYAAIFFVLWARRRSEIYLLHWGASSAVYAAALICFESGSPLPPAAANAFCYGLIGVSDFLLLTGMRRFDGQRPFQAWMAIPIVVAMAVVALAGTLGTPGGAAEKMAGSVALGLCMVICASAILAESRDDNSLPRKMVAAALFAYVAGDVISFGVQFWAPAHADLVSLLPMLQDQVLLGVLNLSLLATPWERALRQVKESALRDGLTGAWNRKALKQHDEDLATPANSLFLIDIDHFKTINDTFGHAAGDAVLVAFAGSIQQLAAERKGVFVRLGGDEFVMIAPAADAQDGRRLAERLREIPDSANPDLPPYSISVGIACVQAGETSLSQAMARADRSLYRAKASGRNQVAA